MNLNALSTRPLPEAPLSPASSSSAASQAAFFGPLHYEPKYAYPLIVWLHGPDADEQQLLRVMPSLSLRNYVGVAPRGLFASAAPHGLALSERSGAVRPRYRSGWIAASPGGACEAVLACIQAARERYHIHPARIFIAGCESGGSLALQLAVQRPDLFAGAVSLAGPFPAGPQALVRFSELRQFPAFLATTHDNPYFSPEALTQQVCLLGSAGLNVAHGVYPGANPLSPEILAEANRWIMNTALGSAA